MSFLAGLIVGVVLALLGASQVPSVLDLLRAPGEAKADEDLRGALDERLKLGEADKADRAMLGGLLGLKTLELKDVMIHRTKMTMLDSARPPAEIIEAVLKSGHTRVPLWQDKPDNIVGILHAKDVLAGLLAHHGDAAKINIEDIAAPPWFVPDTTTVADQLNAFLRRKQQLAIVVDEYGEVMGLVTLEDILEEIVGEIGDEHDVVAAGVRQQKDGSYIIDGAVPIRDLNRALDWRLPEDEATTLAGLIIHEASVIPLAGQAFTFHGFRFEVLRKRRHQVTSVRVTPVGKR